MPILDYFSDEELLIILDCDKFSEMKRKMRRPLDYTALKLAARESYNIKHPKSYVAESLFFSINDATSYSFLILLSIIGSITVQLLPLTIITAVLSMIAMATGAFFYIAAYRQRQREARSMQKNLDFNALKILCANEWIKRNKFELKPDSELSSEWNLPDDENDFPAFEYRNKHKIEKIRPALAFGLLTSSMLFGTYYSGLAIILNAFGAVAAASAMLGPIGISVALAGAIAIGLVCVYVHYRSLVREDRIAQFKEYQSDFLKVKREAIEDIFRQTIHQDLQPAHPLPPASDIGSLNRRAGPAELSEGGRYQLRRGFLSRHRRTAYQAPPPVPTMPPAPRL